MNISILYPVVEETKVYPEFNDSEDFPLFYFEITKWKDTESRHWTLFKRNIIIPAEKWEKQIKDQNNSLQPREGHPYNLASGNLIEEKNGKILDLSTETFLRYLVDALNLKALSENNKS